MARINIEDTIYKDLRFMKLLMKTGSVDHAIGCLVRAWSLAQDWWLNDETGGRIPLEEWNKQGISNLLLEVGLAEAQENLVRVSGSADQFAWLNQKAEAGKKSGEARRHKKTSNECSTETNECSTGVNGDEPLTPTLPLSPPQSLDLNPKTPLTPLGVGLDDLDSLKSAGEKSVDDLRRSASKAQVRLDAVIQLYNDTLAGVGKLKHVRDVGDKTRREFLNSLEAFPTMVHWQTVFELVKKSKKLTGQSESTWFATFSWLAVKENALKVEQGSYDDDFSHLKKDEIDQALNDLKLS